MRYLLLASTPATIHHPTELEAARVEAAVAFCARFEDELAASSELEWSEVLAPPSPSRAHAADGASGADPSADWILSRVWAVRVSGNERAQELAALVTRELAARVEVRECLAGAQRP